MKGGVPPVSVRENAGMTLVEVLVGVFIAGVVIALGVAAFFSITSALDGQGDRQSKIYTLADSVDQLREDLLGTFVTDPDADCGFRLEPSAANPGAWTLSFCSLSRGEDSPDARWADMRSIRYVAEPADPRGVSLLRVEGQLGTFSREPAVYTSVVIQAAASLSILVWQDDGWTNRWPPDGIDPREVMIPPAARVILEPLGSDVRSLEADLPIPAGWTIAPGDEAG